MATIIKRKTRFHNAVLEAILLHKHAGEVRPSSTACEELLEPCGSLSLEMTTPKDGNAKESCIYDERGVKRQEFDSDIKLARKAASLCATKAAIGLKQWQQQSLSIQHLSSGVIQVMKSRHPCLVIALLTWCF